MSCFHLQWCNPELQSIVVDCCYDICVELTGFGEFPSVIGVNVHVGYSSQYHGITTILAWQLWPVNTYHGVTRVTAEDTAPVLFVGGGRILRACRGTTTGPEWYSE